ncbi:MAG: 30S ribosome-binding factor RbfA [Acidobacteria bacterium]|nr:30S ribosome-binding factor RbfA [Acidobacteriota bacterium]
MDEIRLHRISEAMREELTELIEYEMEDPRVAPVTVTEVHVSPDGRKARVMISASSAAGQKEAIQALEHARAFLRTQLAQRLQMRHIPDLQFELDAVVDPARLNSLMKRIRKGRPKEV